MKAAPKSRRSPKRRSRGCAPCPAWRLRRARSSRPGDAADDARQTADERRRAGVRRRRCMPPRFEAFTAVQGRYPCGADEVAIDEATAEREHLRARSAGRDRRPRAGAALHDLRHRQVRRQRIASAARASRCCIPRQAQCVAGEPGATTSIDVAAEPGVTPAAAAPRVCARRCRDVDGAHRRPGSRQPDIRTRRKPRLPAHLPAGVRLRRARRRRVHHLQHLLDHRRPAHARVRPAAHARRLARADHALGGRGRPAARRRRVAVIGLFARDRARAGARPAVQGVRRRPARQRHGAGDAHDRRLAAASASSSRCSPGFVPALRATRVPPLAAMREGSCRSRRGRRCPARRSSASCSGSRVVAIGVASLLGGGSAGGAADRARATRRDCGLRCAPRRPPRQPRTTASYRRSRARSAVLVELARDHRAPRARELDAPARTHAGDGARADVGIGLVAFIAVLAAGTKATIDQAVSRSFAGNLIVAELAAAATGPCRRRVAPARRAPSAASARHARSPSPRAGSGTASGGAGDRRKEHRHGDRTESFVGDVQDRMGARLAGDAARPRTERHA